MHWTGSHKNLVPQKRVHLQHLEAHYISQCSEIDMHDSYMHRHPSLSQFAMYVYIHVHVVHHVHEHVVHVHVPVHVVHVHVHVGGVMSL